MSLFEKYSPDVQELLSSDLTNETFDEFMQTCSARLKHCIQNNDCYSYKDILSLSQRTWSRTPNFGKKCSAELEEHLRSLGLRMREEWEL